MAPIITEDLKKKVTSLIQKNLIMVFSKTTCPFCKKAHELLNSLNATYHCYEIDQENDGAEIQKVLLEITGQKTVPNIFIGGKHVGGYGNLSSLHTRGVLQQRLSAAVYQYDFVVIGGGSGGLAAAREASRLGARVLCLDFVEPTPLGTSWGVGGTCVNVGCIPKKLMHQCALLGYGLEDAPKFGWNLSENVTHNWGKMVESIQNHISSLNWGYRVALREEKVTYTNAMAYFIDEHTVGIRDRGGNETQATTYKILISTGERPKYLGLEGEKELCITSDDLFSLTYCPGKTLVVGASYVALECAGFLASMGLNVTVMVRSILLRGFDRQMSEMVGDYMEEHGIKFIRGYVPCKIERKESGSPGLIEVTAKPSLTHGDQIVDTYNTVLIAIGRSCRTAKLRLENVKITTDKAGLLVTNEFDQTNVDNIFAIGDVASGRPQLTPVAILAGKLLARRLFDGSDEKMNYNIIPTTVFTPLEYGTVGMTEEAAVEKYGDENVRVYHTYFKPLEWTVAGRPNNTCYAKLICLVSENERILGFHVLSPNAGEITQGYVLGMKLGATKHDFDTTVGIHPTCSEIFTSLTATKGSDASPLQTGC